MELVDTNVLTELVRPDPDPGVVAWSADARQVAISVVTLEEIRFGLTWRPNDRVEAAIIGLIEQHCEVMPVTEEIATLAGQMRGELRRRGATRTQADMLIAATARRLRMALVTRNVRDFADLGIALLNPFRGG